jgi:uncharacterized membrane protein YsdA (DUF1294 family)
MERKPAPENQLRTATLLAGSGGAMLAVGLFLGRGMAQGFVLVQIRLAFLVLGLSLAIAGAIGLLAAARARRGKGEARP